MKKHTLVALLGGCLLAFSTQAVLADDIPTTSIQMSSILQNLQTKGYNNVKKIKFEDGEYEAKVINAQGREEKLHINPQTGAILNAPKAAQANITALEAAKKVEAAGYHNIYKLEAEDGNEYEVKAIDKNGKKAELKVNATTGEITPK